MSMKIAKRTDWKTEPLPPRRTNIPLDRSFKPHEMERIHQGLVPAQMEDKWFIFWEDNTLFFHRSWTGFCIFIVHFISEGSLGRMVSADVNRDRDQYSEENDDKDANMISYLIDLLLLHQAAEFPSDEASLEKRALINWGLVGRAGLGEHPNDT